MTSFCLSIPFQYNENQGCVYAIEISDSSLNCIFSPSWCWCLSEWIPNAPQYNYMLPMLLPQNEWLIKFRWKLKAWKKSVILSHMEINNHQTLRFNQSMFSIHNITICRLCTAFRPNAVRWACTTWDLFYQLISHSPGGTFYPTIHCGLF